jgi:hypothetical protein
MSRKRCNRKPVNPAAWLNAITNAQPTRPSEVLRIMVAIRTAYEKLKTGAGTEQDYDRLGAAVNVGMIRAEEIDQFLVDIMMKAGEAMLSCERIRRKHGAFGFHGEDLLAVNAAVDAYESILSASSPLQMDAAARECERRIRAREVITA